jgi:hypothetical protein
VNVDLSFSIGIFEAKKGRNDRLIELITVKVQKEGQKTVKNLSKMIVCQIESMLHFH